MLPENPREWRRLVVFTAVGTVNTVVCYALYAGLVHSFDWHYNAALVADYGFGTVLGYAMHRLMTFADRKHVSGAFGKFTLTLVLTFLLNMVLLDGAVRLQWFDPLTAQALATLVVTLVSYVLQKHWVFNAPLPARAEAVDAPPIRRKAA